MPNTKEQEWGAHIWIGSDLIAWLRLLTAGRFAFSPKFLYLAPLGTLISTANSVLGYLQTGLHGAKIRATTIDQPPIFIIGHWRSGTTLLHELLIQDPRHSYPNTYQCFDPCHFLLTEKLARKYLRWLLPARRWMDNMPVGWERPQEDEFALCMLGQPSPYRTIAFPNNGPIDHAALDLDGLPKNVRDAWKKTFMRYLQTLTYSDPRRLVLKSPPHTCRIPTLLELFPDARFIHIVRNPYAVYSSTLNLWKTLHDKQGMQTPKHDWLEEYVFNTFTHVYDRLETTRGMVASDRFYELKFESLTQNPLHELRQMYEHLDLGPFTDAEAPITRYLDANASYTKNTWNLSPDQRTLITQRWHTVIDRYGYT